MDLGVAYYPEHWPRNRWEEDVTLMAEAGVNFVRMGEFAWSWYEPLPDRLDFSAMDEVVELLAKHGIRTMMCTPSRTPPLWLFERFPEAACVLQNGQRACAGHRYDICLNAPPFIEQSRRIDLAVMEHFAANPHVSAWHIDNEVGAKDAVPKCFCAHCRRAFQRYLEERYGSVEKLNQCWGAHFWSFAVSSFEDVPLPLAQPVSNPSLLMAWRQCRSDLHVEFIRWRYDRIKERCDTMVTTNYQPFFAKHTDYFKVSEILDVPGHNYYPCGAPHELIVQVDFTRGVKGSCLVLEMRTGAPYYEQATRPGMMRLWTYQALAHGAFGINYFRWRTCRFGQEQYWHGILPHSGKPKRLYDEFTSMAHELQDVADKIVKRKVKAEVALVYSYPSRLALDEKLPGYEFNYPATLHGWHKALMRANVAVDIVPPYAELGKYKLVLAPLCYVLMEDEAENMRRFVERGGALLTTYRSSVVDEHNVIYDVALPANLVDVFGVEVAEYDSPPGPLLITGLSEKISANSWCDSIELCGAEPVAVLDEGIFAGQPALTTNRHVAGTAVYLGVDLDTHGLDVVTRFLLDTAQGERRPVTPDGVQVQRLEGDDGPVVIALNFTNAGTEFDLEGKWKDIISGDEFDRLVSVGPRDVRVLEMA